MKEKTLQFSVVCMTILFLSVVQANEERPHQRDYTFVIAPSYEMDLVSVNSWSLNRLVQDTYTKGIAPLIKNESARFWLGEGWGVFWTYMHIIWPHEFGHWIRGKQGAGDFIFHNAALPFPYTTVQLPEDATLEDEIIISIGGFELNSLMANQTANEFYEKRYSYADSMINGLVHKVFFPLYGLAIFPADPEKSDTWENTRGDPVHFVLPTYKRYTGRPALKDDGTVDETLVSFYREATYLSLIWNLLDPFLYQSASAISEDDKLTPFSAGPRIFGDYSLGWIYGTLFNPSPLGYELYLNNYVYLKDRLYILSLKHGRPFKNNSIGLRIPNLYSGNKFSINTELELWDQDIYGVGVAVGSTVKYDYSNYLGVFAKAEWKDRGYQLAKRIQRSATAFIGIIYQI